MRGHSMYNLLGLVLAEVGFVLLGYAKTSSHRDLILSFVSQLSSHVFVGRELELCLSVTHLKNANNRRPSG